MFVTLSYTIRLIRLRKNCANKTSRRFFPCFFFILTRKTRGRSSPRVIQTIKLTLHHDLEVVRNILSKKRSHSVFRHRYTRLFSVLYIMRVCVKPQMGRLREAFTARRSICADVGRNCSPHREPSCFYYGCTSCVDSLSR